MKRMTQKEFIDKCNKNHNKKYNYSLVVYKNSRTKIKIICPTHGVFEQNSKAHKEGQGCSKCSGTYKMTTKEFIEKSKKIYEDKYDYSLVKYINSRIPIKLIENEYNITITQLPSHHLNGHIVSKPSTELFIEKSKKIYKNKYDYSLVKYINRKTPIKLIDNEYGYEFEQLPSHHLEGYGTGIVTNEIFIKKCIKIHNNKYDYSLVKIKSNKDKVKIICPTHGIFKQTVSNHMNMKQNCPKCAGKYSPTTEEFIKKCKNIYNNKYDYSLVKYKNSNSIIKIICPDHGIFEQRALKHLHSEQGCVKCNTTSKGENKISKILSDNEIEYLKEYSFDDCKYVNKLPFDFYLPSKNIIIEYDGIQHFKAIEFFGGEKYFEIRQKIDVVKNLYCEENNIYLIRIPYTDYNNVEDILQKNNVIS